ncbi:hypothetical protein MKX03_006106, partial [Papaver bracteatum]
TEKKHLEEIESLKVEFSSRDSKYRSLKKKLMVTVSNLNKEALRLRNAQVKKCAEKIYFDHNIPLPDFDFPEVPANEEDSEISDSEVEYEEYEETEDEDGSGSETGGDYEFEEDSSKSSGIDMGGK